MARRREERNVVICQSICIGKPELVQNKHERRHFFLSFFLVFTSTKLAYEYFILCDVSSPIFILLLYHLLRTPKYK
jgi:hypothetical protein